MKKLILLALLALLVGCSSETIDATSEYSMPAELADCKIYKISPEFGATLYITRCSGENSGLSTTVASKYPSTTITIDGKYYNLVPK